jgi:hypothetical protein
MNGHRPKIGEHPELAPQAEQALLRTLSRGGIVPTRTTDSAEQNSVSVSAQIDSLRRQRSPARIKCASADQSLGCLNLVAVAFRDSAKNARAFGYNLRSDAIAWQEGDRQ